MDKETKNDERRLVLVRKGSQEERVVVVRLKRYRDTSIEETPNPPLKHRKVLLPECAEDDPAAAMLFTMTPSPPPLQQKKQHLVVHLRSSNCSPLRRVISPKPSVSSP